MRALLRSAVHGLDLALSRGWQGLLGDPPGLRSFMFHALFPSRREVDSGLIDPFQPVTLADFRAFIDHFLEQGYRFVAPADLANGLDPGGRYALISFDDGYANNLAALPLLHEFDVPAVFFISANHVAEGRGYWWDVLYRCRRRQGRTPEEIGREQEALKALTHREIEATLQREFGAAALSPEDELDRPMTEAELAGFARDPHVTVGNHTADHAILTVHDDAEAAAQIRACQDYLAKVIGAAPGVIAYPNGNHDARVVALARREGLGLGFVTEPRRARLPLSADGAMTIGRYALDGGPGLRDPCRLCQSGPQLVHGSRRLRRWLRRD